MNHQMAIREFCNKIGAYEHGIEYRSQIKHPQQYFAWDHNSPNIDALAEIIQKEYTVVAIPTENFVSMVQFLSAKASPTEESFFWQMKKRELYDTDPEFKKLYDEMNTYLFMFSDYK